VDTAGSGSVIGSIISRWLREQLGRLRCAGIRDQVMGMRWLVPTFAPRMSHYPVEKVAPRRSTRGNTQRLWGRE